MNYFSLALPARHLFPHKWTNCVPTLLFFSLFFTIQFEVIFCLLPSTLSLSSPYCNTVTSYTQCLSVTLRVWAQRLVQAGQGRSRLNGYLSLCGNRCNPEHKHPLIQNRIMLSVGVRGWTALLIWALLTWSSYCTAMWMSDCSVCLCAVNDNKAAHLKASTALTNDDAGLVFCSESS